MVANQELKGRGDGNGVFAHRYPARSGPSFALRVNFIILGNLAALDFVMPANEAGKRAVFNRNYPLAVVVIRELRDGGTVPATSQGRIGVAFFARSTFSYGDHIGWAV